MMHRTVTEGGGQRVRSARQPVGHARRIVTACALVAVAYLAVPSVAQPGGSKPVFRAKVLDLSSVSQRIEIPINRSVVVQTSVEAIRADAVASETVDARMVSPTELLVTGHRIGSGNVVIWDKDDQQYVLEVSVELDLRRLNESLGSIDPQGTVQARSLYGHIVLSGTVSSAERARQMVELAGLFIPLSEDGTELRTVKNHLQVAGEQQVHVRCVVAEISRSAARELGINGFLAGDNVRDAFMVNQLGGLNPINIGAAGNALVNGVIPFLTDTAGISIAPQSTISLGFPRVQMQLFIRALADNSLATVLAEPNLVAISGETASFLAGGEFPIPVPQGNQQVTIEFREFGIRLNFTPVVKAHQRIRLRIAPEVSELDFQSAVQIEGFVVPGLTTRASETTVEVGSGETIAIAGLLSEEVRGLASRIPGIGDIPILGALFRSVKFQRSLTELVILVTPEIVAPLDAHQMVKIPGADVVNPDDFELYALGLLEEWPRQSNDVSSDDDDPSLDGLLESEPDEVSLHGPWGRSAESDVR